MNKYIAVVLSHRVWGWFIRHQWMTERKVNAKKNAKMFSMENDEMMMGWAGNCCFSY